RLGVGIVRIFVNLDCAGVPGREPDRMRLSKALVLLVGKAERPSGHRAPEAIANELLRIGVQAAIAVRPPPRIDDYSLQKLLADLHGEIESGEAGDAAERTIAEQAASCFDIRENVAIAPERAFGRRIPRLD